MESLFMEESAMNLRSFGLYNSTTSKMYGGFGFKSPRQYNYLLHHPHDLHPCSSVSSINQLLIDANNAAAAGSFRGSLPTFPPLYSSLPPVPVRCQPPLLPLPIKSATLRSTNKKISTGTGPALITRSSSSSAATPSARQNNNQKRKKKNPKPSTSLKEPAVAAAKPIKNKAAAAAAAEEKTEEEFLIKSPSSPSVYSLSPPPSSLPLPRLLLMRYRPRTAKVAPAGISCNAEARGVGVDSGAADDPRKIPRL